VLDEEVWPGFNNPVNAAVATMISGMPKDRGKPVLVVAGSDFAETCGPCISEAHARQAAQSEGVAVYGIVNRTREPPTQIGSFPVAKLSEATGGGYVLLKSGDDIRSLMKQVTEELRHEYLLGFTPAVADGRQHTVTVEVVRPHHRAMARVRDSRRRK
jgi:hypothetical protein